MIWKKQRGNYSFYSRCRLSPNRNIFYGGGSESDNWALKAAAEAFKSKGNHITTRLNITQFFTLANGLKNGYEVTYLDVDEYGKG